MLSFPVFPSFSQDTIDNFTEQKIEDMAENAASEDQDYSSLLEHMAYYRKHPLNLNTATREELQQFPFLSEWQIQHLLDHIEKNGKLVSIYEIQSVEGFDLQTIRLLLPYVKVADGMGSPPAAFPEILRHGEHEFISYYSRVLEQEKGFAAPDPPGICAAPNSRCIGSPERLYERYRFRYGESVSAGFAAEKDPGELLLKRNRRFQSGCYDSLLNGKVKNGFDFYSAHLFLRNRGFVKALALGDYQVGFGQGLTAWSSLAYGKTFDAINIKKYGEGISPYTSLNENKFMRGAAATLGGRFLQFTAFFSRNKVDANVAGRDSAGRVVSFSSLQTTGLHTTPAEMADKGSVAQTVLGGNVSFRKKKFTVGITGQRTLFNAEFQPTSSSYNQFDFRGREMTNLGADYSFLLRNFSFFGEGSLSENRGAAFVGGLMALLDPKISVSVLYRQVQSKYQNLWTSILAESSAPQSNEQGIYMGTAIKPSSALTLNFSCDYFEFPWLKYQINGPSRGTSCLAHADYSPNKKLDMYVKVRVKNKFQNAGSSNEIDYPVPVSQTNIRWNFSYQVLPKIMLRSRVEQVRVNQASTGKETGFLIYQDVLWKKIAKRFSLAFRYALFDTQSYNSRVFAFEEDVPGAYYIPSYYYKGSRVYLMASAEAGRNIELWLRWSQTCYGNRNVISAGSLNEIDGNTKSEVRMEVRMRF